MKKILKYCLVFLFFIFSGKAFAIDAAGFAIGAGDDDVTRYRIIIQKDWDKNWFAEKSINLSGYWEAGLDYWDGDSGKTNNDSLAAASILPVFRLQPQKPLGNNIYPYIDASIGFYLLSDTKIGDKRMSTAFQFGDHIGIGLRFGSKNEIEIGYRLEHISNGSIKRPNDGINFHMLRVSYHF